MEALKFFIKGLLVVAVIVGVSLWFKSRGPKEIETTQVPPPFCGLWRNVTHDTAPADCLIISSKCIEHSLSNGYLETSDVLSAKVTTSSQSLRIRLVCRERKNGLRTYELISKGDLLMNASEMVPTGNNDDMGYVLLGDYVRTHDGDGEPKFKP